MLDRRLVAYGSAALIFALDRFTKHLVETRISLEESIRVIPGFFELVRSQNKGVAFGIFNESQFEWRTILLIIAALTAVVVVSWILRKPERLDRWSYWGLALVLGGAAGNLYDRIIAGQVTDFLLFYIGSYQWPAFNVADTAVVVGSGLLLVDMVRPKRQAANVS